MTTHERAIQIYQILITCAHERRILTYEILGEMVGLPPMSLGAHLTHLMNWCDTNQLPPITVLVVQKDSGKPGVGFTSFEDLHRDRERAFAHDWFKMKPLTAQDLLAP